MKTCDYSSEIRQFAFDSFFDCARHCIFSVQQGRELERESAAVWEMQELILSFGAWVGLGALAGLA